MKLHQTLQDHSVVIAFIQPASQIPSFFWVPRVTERTCLGTTKLLGVGWSSNIIRKLHGVKHNKLFTPENERISPENWCLKDEMSLKKVPLQGDMFIFFLGKNIFSVNITFPALLFKSFYPSGKVVFSRKNARNFSPYHTSWEVESVERR